MAATSPAASIERPSSRGISGLALTAPITIFFFVEVPPSTDAPGDDVRRIIPILPAQAASDSGQTGPASVLDETGDGRAAVYNPSRPIPNQRRVECPSALPPLSQDRGSSLANPPLPPASLDHAGAGTAVTTHGSPGAPSDPTKP